MMPFPPSAVVNEFYAINWLSTLAQALTTHIVTMLRRTGAKATEYLQSDKRPLGTLIAKALSREALRRHSLAMEASATGGGV